MVFGLALSVVAGDAFPLADAVDGGLGEAAFVAPGIAAAIASGGNGGGDGEEGWEDEELHCDGRLVVERSVKMVVC